VVVLREDNRLGGNKEINRSMRSALGAKLGQIPQTVRLRIDNALKELSSRDLQSIDLRGLISDIMEEYQDMEG
jgi:hypothetical protein